ncbi:TauD/TfdA family dioxygenase [Streptomyces albidoflavus]
MDQLGDERVHRPSGVGRVVGPTEISAQLAARGIALFQGVEGASHLLEVAQTLGSIVPHPDGDENGVTVIAERRERALDAMSAGFSRAALEPHTDRANLTIPPALLLTLCTVSAVGGESTFADGAVVHRTLASHDPLALQALCRPDAVSYGRTHVYTGPVFEPVGHEPRMRLRLWPKEAGRFSPEAESALAPLHRAIATAVMTVQLEAGQGYVVDNHRWLHGRRSFTGDRVMLRIGVRPLRSAELRTGIASPAAQGADRG